MLPKTLSKEEQDAIKHFKSRLQDKFPKDFSELRLFGSKARGDMHAESDIDLLVIVNERTEDLDDFVIDLVCEILNQFGVYLGTVTYAKENYEKDLSLQLPFLLNVDRESILI